MLHALHRWIARHRGRRAPRPRPHGLESLLVGAASEPDDDRPRGCGWFDSSHDLRCGLQIREHASADAVANDLPLGDWLDLHLIEWRGLAPSGHH